MKSVTKFRQRTAGTINVGQRCFIDSDCQQWVLNRECKENELEELEEKNDTYLTILQLKVWVWRIV